LRAHTAKITQDWLKANMENHWSLGTKILEVMADLDREVVICSYKKFRSRIEAVIGARGDFII
jgi:hypothetical protein